MRNAGPMPLEGQHPAYGLQGTEQAQALRAAQEAQARAAADAAAAETQARAAQRLSGAVEEPKEVEGSTLQGDRRGARSFERPAKGPFDSAAPGGLAQGKPASIPPPDPEGRGTSLDVRA